MSQRQARGAIYLPWRPAGFSEAPGRSARISKLAISLAGEPRSGGGNSNRLGLFMSCFQPFPGYVKTTGMQHQPKNSLNGPPTPEEFQRQLSDLMRQHFKGTNLGAVPG